MQSDGPLRILQVVEATDAGVGRHVLDLCDELARRGHEVHLVYSGQRMEPRFARRMQGIAGLRQVDIPMRTSLHVGDLAALIRIVRYARRHRSFSLFHGHSSKGGALARIAGAMMGVPALYTPNAFRTQDPELGRFRLSLYALLERILARIGSEIITVSHDERRHAEERLGLSPRRLHVVFNGLPLDRRRDERHSRESLGLPAEAVVVGFVGRLAHQKAPERLVDALDRIDLPAVHLALVGDGPAAQELKRVTVKRGLESRVHWLGAIDGFSTMPLFDLFVLPSRYEGLPYVLIEALMTGLPIVASDVGGTREVVQHGVNGLIVPEGDTEALTTAIRRIASDADLRRSMAAESLVHARAFSLTEMVDRTLAVYNVALVRQSGGAPVSDV